MTVTDPSSENDDIVNLTSGNIYDIYFVAEDIVENRSNVKSVMVVEAL